MRWFFDSGACARSGDGKCESQHRTVCQISAKFSNGIDRFAGGNIADCKCFAWFRVVLGRGARFSFGESADGQDFDGGTGGGRFAG